MPNSSSDDRRLGSFRILRELGSGGMGRVYLATEDGPDASEPGTHVALKVVHRHLLERAGFFKRFLREAEIGKAVRHENVIQTIDVDAVIENGHQVNFLVMEYVEGRTLRDLLQEYGTLPEGLLREIAIQVTRGLVAIHERNIVHRDLKPENVLVTKDNLIRIMDLGVAHLQEVSARITGENEFLGSLLYAAPEQFRGEKCGASADLYSLGVLLMELATGRNPFHSEVSAQVIQAHLNLMPERPQQINSNLSDFFDELVMVLLGKTPNTRFESSAALLDALEGGEKSSWWALRQREERKVPWRLPLIDVARDHDLHGRSNELGLLNDAWLAAKRGQGGAVVISGAAGVGKTRLIDTFVQGLDYGTGHMLYGSFEPAHGIAGLSDAVIAFFSLAGIEEGVARYVDRPESVLAGFGAMVRRAALPEGAEPVGVQDQRKFFADLIGGLGDDKPTLWVVENVQYGSEESYETILAMARAAAGARALIVLTCNDCLSCDRLGPLTEAGICRQLALGPLSPRSVVEFLRDALGGEAIADKLGSMIAYKTDGVPNAMLEMIHAMTEGSLLRRMPDGSYVEIAENEQVEVPHAMQELLEARLSTLTSEERTLLEVAAVQGHEFDAETIARASGLKRVQVLRDLAGVERRLRLIISDGQGFRFDQVNTQQHLYRSMPPALAGEYHWVIAQTLARRSSVVDWQSPNVDGAQAMEVLSHSLRSHRPESFLQCLLPVLRYLEREDRYVEELELVERAESLDGVLLDRERTETSIHKAACLGVFGDRDGERAAVDEATSLALKVKDPALMARAWIAKSRHLIDVGASAEARSNLDSNLELARRTRDLALEADTCGLLGLVDQHAGAYDSARSHFERWLELESELSNPHGELAAAQKLSNLFLDIGIHDMVRHYLEQQLCQARELGAQRHLASAHMTQGRLRLIERDFAQARRDFEQSLATYHSIGDRLGEANASGGLGHALLATGDLVQARAYLEQCARIGREVRSSVCEASALLGQGRLLAVLGDFDRARSLLEGARDRCVKANENRILADVLHELGWLEHRSGDPSAAGRLYVEALGLRRQTGDRAGGMETLVRQAGLQIAAGHDADARALVNEVLALARDLDVPDWTVLAHALGALLPGGDPVAAAEVFEAREARLPFTARLEAQFLLWKATQKPLYLRRANILLDELDAQTPREMRERMQDSVPLYREIKIASRSLQTGAPEASASKGSPAQK